MENTIVDVIKDKYNSMTKKQRILADYMLLEPEAMAFMTLKELSQKTGVSEVTILHACTVLDCNNYNELKYEFRKYISVLKKLEVQKQNLYACGEVPNYELTNKHKLMREILQGEQDLYNLMFNNLKMDSIFDAANMLIDAGNIIICARGASMQVADFLSMRLATMGLPSVVMNTELNDSIQASLPLFNSSVLMVAISLPDYYIMTTKVCEFAKQKRSRILCLTDSEAQSPVAEFGDLVITVPSSTRLFLNTIGPMMSLINLITSAVNIEKGLRKNRTYTTTEEFAMIFNENVK